MCDAEDELRGMERAMAKMEDRIERICDLVDDCERGMLTLPELRREADFIRNGPVGAPSYV